MFLEDVGELKGQSEMKKLHNFLDKKGLEFVEFSPLYSTWPIALTKIANLIK